MCGIRVVLGYVNFGQLPLPGIAIELLIDILFVSLQSYRKGGDHELFILN